MRIERLPQLCRQFRLEFLADEVLHPLGRLMKDPEFPEDAKALGKLLKANAWRILGHPVDDAPPSAPPPP